MSASEEFVDYYNILQVSHDCDARTLEVSYHFLAKMYHPDNTETANVDKFGAVVEAYRALRNPEDRAEYDRIYFGKMGNPQERFSFSDESSIDEETAVHDADIHAKVLFHLYTRRRERAADPGVAAWLLEERLGCSEDQFEFHVWYLKSKGLIIITEQGTLAITVAGVDHVISTSRTTLKEQLRIVHADAEQPSSQSDGAELP